MLNRLPGRSFRQAIPIAQSARALPGRYSRSALATRLNVAAGTANVASIVVAPGVTLTTAAAGAQEFDGTAFYMTAAAASRQVADAEQFMSLTAINTLASQTAAQKIFNTPANGTVTVAGATTYFFECVFSLTALSAVSGSFGFAFGGTATFTSQAWTTQAAKVAAAATPAALETTFNTAANAAIVTASINTVGVVRVFGIVRILAAGTLIPQVSLGVAAAAVVGVNSYFRLWPVGSNTVTAVGNMS